MIRLHLEQCYNVHRAWSTSLSYIAWIIVTQTVAYLTQSKNMLNVPI